MCACMLMTKLICLNVTVACVFSNYTLSYETLGALFLHVIYYIAPLSAEQKDIFMNVIVGTLMFSVIGHIFQFSHKYDLFSAMLASGVLKIAMSAGQPTTLVQTEISTN